MYTNVTPAIASECVEDPFENEGAAVEGGAAVASWSSLGMHSTDGQMVLKER